MFGFINRVDKVIWPPLKNVKSADVSSVSERLINSVDKTKHLFQQDWSETQNHSFD